MLIGDFDQCGKAAHFFLSNPLHQVLKSSSPQVIKSSSHQVINYHSDWHTQRLLDTTLIPTLILVQKHLGTQVQGISPYHSVPDSYGSPYAPSNLNSSHPPSSASASASQGLSNCLPLNPEIAVTHPHWSPSQLIPTTSKPLKILRNNALARLFWIQEILMSIGYAILLSMAMSVLVRRSSRSAGTVVEIIQEGNQINSYFHTE